MSTNKPERDPSLIERAGEVAREPSEQSKAIAKAEAADAAGQQKVASTESKSFVGRFASTSEIRYWAGVLIVFAAFIACIVFLYQDDPKTRYTSAAWALLVTITSGALGLIFISKADP